MNQVNSCLSRTLHCSLASWIFRVKFTPLTKLEHVAYQICSIDKDGKPRVHSEEKIEHVVKSFEGVGEVRPFGNGTKGGRGCCQSKCTICWHTYNQLTHLNYTTWHPHFLKSKAKSSTLTSSHQQCRVVRVCKIARYETQDRCLSFAGRASESTRNGY